MHSLLLDLRAAARGLIRTPAFTGAAVLSLGLAVGANTTVFSWMESMVLRPFPAIPETDRLVVLNQRSPDGHDWPLSYPVYREWRTGARAFAGIAAWSPFRLSLREAEAEAAAPVWAMLASGGYFDVLGAPPVLGRGFTRDEESAASPVAVIAYDYWQRRFARDRTVLGRTVLLNGHPVTIIGIAAPGFHGTYAGVTFDLWLPLTLQPLLTGATNLEDRSIRWLQAIARLAPTRTISQARTELDALARTASMRAGDQPVVGALVRMPREQFLGALLFPVFSVMLGVTALVLLVACGNLAGLLLVRATAHRRELAIRLAIGAGRAALLRLALVESALLGVLAGVVGILIALVLKGIFYRFIPPVPFTIDLGIRINARILLFTGLCCSVTALGLGLLPALRNARLELAAILRHGSRAGSAGDSILRNALVSGQIAFATVCLVCSGLFLHSFARSLDVELGFTDPERMLLVNVNLAGAGFDEAAGKTALADLLRRVRALPGADAASVASMVPLGFGGHRFIDARVAGYEAQRDEDLAVEQVLVGPTYFETIGTPILEGRGIIDADQSGAREVVVVNQAFVRRFLPNGNALERRVQLGTNSLTIVGVARDSKYSDLTETPYPVAYLPVAQTYQPNLTLHVRTSVPPLRLAESIRGLLFRIHPDLAALEPRTLAQHLGASTFPLRIGAAMLAGFGAIALLLAAVGLYGVLSYLVAIRSREIGIRAALGAPRGQLIRMVTLRAVALIGSGLTGGFLLAAIAANALRAQLIEVGPLDPITYGVVAALFLLVALLASLRPALRILSLQPLVALRTE